MTGERHRLERGSKIKATFSVAEAAAILGLSEKATRAAAKRGDLPSLVIGGRVLILKEPLLKLVRASHTPRD